MKTMTPRRLGINIFEHQQKVIAKLRTGSVLQGGVGSGKSIAALLYYYVKECGGTFLLPDKVTELKSPKDLYIITTARKRDSLEWVKECAIFALSTDRKNSINNILVTIDSWNNIKKYVDVENAFFIFDEQRVVGHGTWVKSFLRITKNNNWILLSATPGDTWLDYVPVFIANRFYKNRTEFLRRHVVYNTFSKFPKIDHYVEVDRLEKIKKYVTVVMEYEKPTETIDVDLFAEYDKELLEVAYKKRWNPFTNKPIKDVSQLFYTCRKIINSHPSRLLLIEELLIKHAKLIVFYNFDYELELLKEYFSNKEALTVAEYNGHKHEEIPSSNKWLYLVQYMSGGEGWNCIETNAMAFYSQNYSYRMMTQAAGRINRLNTTFIKLYYYHIMSNSFMDRAIRKALKNKKKFNENNFYSARKTQTIMRGE